MILLINVKGAVQGVGYRPFIAEKATEYGLKGYVKNIGAAVEILAAGDEAKLRAFADLLEREYPAGAFILSVDIKEETADKFEYEDFSIIESTDIVLSSELPVFLPDIGICDDCLKEMLDHKDKRHDYPLISCAVCGPRISIADALPYDRDTTAMKSFDMCPSCQKDYKKGRRRHAQTISCFDCGPQMVLEYFDGEKHFEGKNNAVEKAIKLLRNGEILGLKGASGYQLVSLPQNDIATKLREIKGRESKPFAIMFSDIDKIKEYCKVSSFEEELLRSSARPIVLLEKIKDFPYEVCRDSDFVGAFLPSVGVHRLLCDALGPLIVTSANRSGEPMIITDDEFDKVFFAPDEEPNRNGQNVDGVLRHDRRINMAQDDSVVFALDELGKEPVFIRRARGYVPLPVFTGDVNAHDKTVLAFGGDLKSTFSFGKKDRVISSQYVGDLEDLYCLENYKKYIAKYTELFHIKPDMLVCDLHPGYHSANYAKDLADELKLPIYEVQHHHAHALSVMAENSLRSCIGVSLDGTGYGTDGKIWGGEFLLCNNTDVVRVGHISYVKLCGGDKASVNADFVKMCYEFGCDNESQIDPVVRAALLNNINTFEYSGTGRLFDAVCAILEIKKENSYEGECAIFLENAARRGMHLNKPELSFMINDTGDGFIADQLRLFSDVKKAYESGRYEKEAIAFSFHMALSKAVADMCLKIRDKYGENKVCLSGGVFANRILLKEIISDLKKEKFEVYRNKLVPSGDAGISLGQAYYGLLKEV